MDVRTLCLGVLSMGPASGYEIKKRLEGPFRHFYDASFGSIYPALNRLEEAGLVEHTVEAQHNRPDKKIFRVTASGRLELMRELAEPPGEDRVRSEFLVTMMFADLLPARHVSELMDGRIALMRSVLEHLEAMDYPGLSPGKRFVLGYGIAVTRAKLEYLEENRHLVESDALLAQVQSGRAGSEAAD
jgi:PadR family transcriptional regulator, regulatory protein AphA